MDHQESSGVHNMRLQTLATPIRRCLYAFCLSSASMLPASASESESFWHEVKPVDSAPAQPQTNEGSAIPSHYRELHLDLPGLHQYLSATGKSGQEGSSSRQVSLPLPQGGFSQFNLLQSGVIPTALAKRFPNILSFKGSDSSGRLVSLDLSSKSLRASISNGQDVWLIQRAWNAQGNTQATAEEAARYFSFSQFDIPPEKPAIDSEREPSTATPPYGVPRGNILYNFRVAITSNSGFTQAFGGTVEDGLFAVVNTVNRVNRVFERDLGVSFTLTDENDKLILTDPALDPINDGFTWHESNRKLMDRLIGANSYDVGFMFTPHEGGSAGGIGNTCVVEGGTPAPKKHTAYGDSGHHDPVNAPKFFETTVHEFGHKLGAQHVFEGNQIMGYGSPRYAYFHALSLDEMHAWLQSLGGQCATKALNPVNAPWIDHDSLPMPHMRVPANTPFRLSATVLHSAPNAALTYAWDPMNGPLPTEITDDPGYGNLSIPLLPSSSNERTYPSLPVILNEKLPTPGDLYPKKSRDLNFNLTVRDNQAVHPTTAKANVKVGVVDTGTAFAVTVPSSSVNWKAGEIYDIAWDVAGTDVQPISCLRVAVHLSIDGGHNFLKEPLVTKRLNNGSAAVKLPLVNTVKARLSVSCEDNIFFAVSPTDFVITP